MDCYCRNSLVLHLW